MLFNTKKLIIFLLVIFLFLVVILSGCGGEGNSSVPLISAPSSINSPTALPLSPSPTDTSKDTGSIKIQVIWRDITSSLIHPDVSQIEVIITGLGIREGEGIRETIDRPVIEKLITNVPAGIKEIELKGKNSSGELLCHRKTNLIVVKGQTVSPENLHLGISILTGGEFCPQTIHILPGDTLYWVNNDNVPRTVTSDNPFYFKSGTIGPGEGFSYLFNTGGSYPYKGNNGESASVIVDIASPQISDFSPLQGLPGTEVTINGLYFDTEPPPLVRFNGVEASINFVSDVKIRATVPAGAAIGPITVETPAGTGMSSPDFAVLSWLIEPLGIGQTDLNGIYFLDSNNGWLVGDSNTIFTFNGNSGSWENLFPNLNPQMIVDFYCVDFTDFSNGLAGCSVVSSGSYVFKTFNGGDFWNRVVNNSIFGIHFYDIHYISSTGNAWLVGEDVGGPAVFFTDGSNWYNPIGAPTGRSLNGVHFLNDTDGWAVGEDNSVNGSFFSSSSGGFLWTDLSNLLSPSPPILNDIYFSDSSNGWIVGNNGAIYHTSNGGTDWSLQTSNVSENLNRVHFINSSNGWIVGDNGEILVTINGGVTWSEQGSETGEDLNDIHMIDTSIGWIVGNEGILLRYDP